MICGDQVPAISSVSSPVRSLGDRFFEHRLIEFEAHFLDVARLLLAQEIAGAADIEIVAGQREAGAEGVEGLQDFQALLGAVGQRRLAGVVSSA